MRLVDALAKLPPEELTRWAERRGIEIDREKRQPPAVQVSKRAAELPRRLTLSEPTASMARELVASPGRLPRRALGGGGLALVELGLAFVDAASDELFMPDAFRLGLEASPAESPRAVRRLLAHASDETVRTFQQRLGTPASKVLVLEHWLARIEDAAGLERELSALVRREQLVLQAIESRGGEVSIEVFLDLALEPARWSGAALPKRGHAHALLAGGFVFAVPGERIVLPTEVAAIVGKPRREALRRERAAIVRAVDGRDDEPTRAAFAGRPAPRAVALLLEARDPLEPAAPLRRTRLQRAATTLAIEPRAAAMLASLASVLPLATLSLDDLDRELVRTWRTGRAYDELRLEPLVRATSAADPDQQTSPTPVLRECLLAALFDLPESRFAPIADVVRAARSDLRAEGCAESLTALSRRSTRPTFVASIDDALTFMLEVSLAGLGLVDVGRDRSVRLAARARRLDELRDGGRARPRVAAKTDVVWLAPTRFEVPSDALLGPALAVAPLAHAFVESDRLLFELAPAETPLALAKTAVGLVEKLGASEETLALFERALPSMRAKTDWIAASAIIPLEDTELVQAVLADPKLAAFVETHPLVRGLVVRADAPAASVRRALLKHGIDVVKDRGRSSTSS